MFIRTDRLLLRPGWADDAAALHAAFASEAVVMTLANAPWPYRISDAEAFLNHERAANEVDLLAFARTASAPLLVGGVGLAQRGAETELGYWLAPSYWGRGLATEAASALIAAARDSFRLERLSAGYFVGNAASARVLEKLGFVETGHDVRRCRARDASLPFVDCSLTLQRAA